MPAFFSSDQGKFDAHNAVLLLLLRRIILFHIGRVSAVNILRSVSAPQKRKRLIQLRSLPLESAHPVTASKNLQFLIATTGKICYDESTNSSQNLNLSAWADSQCVTDGIGRITPLGPLDWSLVSARRMEFDKLEFEGSFA